MAMTEDQALERLARMTPSDEEGAHRCGDEILIAALRAVGWDRLADEWERLSSDWWWA